MIIKMMIKSIKIRKYWNNPIKQSKIKLIIIIIIIMRGFYWYIVQHW